MYIVPKKDLRDEAYYEGMIEGTNNPCVAKWNAKDNKFEYVLYHWSGTILACMTYWDDMEEYFESFQPLFIVEPRVEYRIESLKR